MKRLIKLLSIFGVLIILGSCSSSKSVNVTAITGETKYIFFKTYEGSPYNVAYIEISGGEYNLKTFYTGSQIKVDSSVKYNITWYWIDPTNSIPLQSSSKTNYPFDFDYSTSLISLGTGNTYKNIFVPTSLDD